MSYSELGQGISRIGSQQMIRMFRKGKDFTGVDQSSRPPITPTLNKLVLSNEKFRPQDLVDYAVKMNNTHSGCVRV